MYLRLPSLLAVVLLLSNCANMNEAECLNADWQTIGFEDGAVGKNQTSISRHRKECAKHSVTPDLTAYRNGHFAGSKQFCTLNNGFRRGNAGKNYNRNCPEELEPIFLAGFSDGQTLFALKQVLKQHTRTLENAYSRIETLDRKIAIKNDLMIADGLKREQRKAIRDEIIYHQEEQVELYDLLPQLQQEFEASLAAYDQGVEQFSDYL